jgi:hypothetical protein
MPSGTAGPLTVARLFLNVLRVGGVLDIFVFTGGSG